MPKLKEDVLVIDQEKVALQTYRMRLKAPAIAKEAAPGQFLMLRARDGIDPLLRRPFSFHRILPEEGIIEILYRVVGRGTWILSQATPGTVLDAIGPLGNGFDMPQQAPKTVFLLAGGIGIAPLFELMMKLAASPALQQPKAIHLFYGARTADELLPAAIFHDLGISVHQSTDDGSLGYCGYVTQLLQEFAEAQKLRPDALYACGPLAMQYHAAQWALANDIPTQLSLESLMACGLGACLGCALPAAVPGAPTEDRYVHVCKDGPIFDAGSIEWKKIQIQQMPTPIFQCI